MQKPLEIRRIDLLVHPFCGRISANDSDIFYSAEQGAELLKIWESHIDEAGRDRSRLLFLTPTGLQSKSQKELYKKLLSHAKEKLGERFVFFEKPNSRSQFNDLDGFPYQTLEALLLAKHFRINRLRVKTRGLGEFARGCVPACLFGLNKLIGMPDPVPYRNSQSVVLVRKSVGMEFRPWELGELMKTTAGRKLLKSKGKAYAKNRRNSANNVAIKNGKGANYFKPRKMRTRR
ncbi:MAG: hypothetical protein WC634_00010 [archaeon]